MKGDLIAISTYCSLHNVNPEFITSLENEGLIQLTIIEEGSYIDEEQLHQLEVYTRWYELGINPEGIDALAHLVQKVRDMQTEINRLRALLRMYQQGDSGTEI